MPKVGEYTTPKPPVLTTGSIDHIYAKKRWSASDTITLGALAHFRHFRHF
jgi:hypothetical protein